MTRSAPAVRIAIIVDDHEHARYLADAVTDLNAGWVLGHARTLDGLARYLGEVIPDAVVTDLQLPGVRCADDCLARVRSMWPGPALVVTGDAGREAASAAVQHGAPLYLKPVTPRELVAALNDLFSAPVRAQESRA